MMRLLYEGPAPTRTFHRGREAFTVSIGETYEVDDDFGAELLAMNPDGMTADEAAPYCIPVFRDLSDRQHDEGGE